MPEAVRKEINELCAVMVQSYEEHAAQVGESFSSDEDLTPSIETME